MCIGELGEASVLDWCAVGRDTGRSAYRGRFGLEWPWLLSTTGGVNRPRRETGRRGWRVVVHRGRCRQAEIMESLSTARGVEVQHQGRCQQAEIMESPRTAGGVEVSPIPRDCILLVNKNSLRSMLSSKN